MPKIRRRNLPPALLDHLLDRVRVLVPMPEVALRFQEAKQEEAQLLKQGAFPSVTWERGAPAPGRHHPGPSRPRSRKELRLSATIARRGALRILPAIPAAIFQLKLLGNSISGKCTNNRLRAGRR